MPKKDKDTQGYYGFDSTGLEKAAAVRLITPSNP
jgi:hypothetical protein